MKKEGELLTNDIAARELRQFIQSGLTSAGTVPRLVKEICRNEGWRERIDEQTRERHVCRTFEEFVTARPLKGLGSTLDVLKKLCAGDAEAETAIDDALSNPCGTNQHVSNRHNQTRPSGTTRARSLRKLRTEAEKSEDVREVYERVLAGEISPHRGMVECGFRKVPTPLEQAKKLVGKMSAADRHKLLTWMRTL